jgi:hypothetical protein
MPELFLIKNHEINTASFSISDETILHENILEILFKFKETLCSKFHDICGTFFIDHLAINIINSDNKVVIFSATPSVEYNLISQKLWKYDKSFSARYQTENKFYSWEKAYENEYFDKLKLTKQTNHGFSFGFNLSKKIESLRLVYSFATRYKKSNLMEYYRGYTNELLAIGDYCYKAISKVYEKQFEKIPILTNEENIPKAFSPFLKLIK